jgi:diaminopimelate epimerase
VMAAGFRLKRLNRQATVTLPGGDLFMEIREKDGHIIMTGPVTYEFEGELPPHLAD